MTVEGLAQRNGEHRLAIVDCHQVAKDHPHAIHEPNL